MFVMISGFERIFGAFACCKMLVDFIYFDLKYIYYTHDIAFLKYPTHFTKKTFANSYKMWYYIFSGLLQSKFINRRF